jgi:hypothetical protein
MAMKAERFFKSGTSGGPGQARMVPRTGRAFVAKMTVSWPENQLQEDARRFFHREIRSR